MKYIEHVADVKTHDGKIVSVNCYDGYRAIISNNKKSFTIIKETTIIKSLVRRR